MEQKKKTANFYRINKKIHYWGSLIVAIPLVIMIGTGVLLMLKKQIAWVQPPTIKGVAKVPELSFDEILKVASTVPEGQISSWKNVDKLDVRPKKGVTKVRAKNNWEIQIDSKTGEVLQVEYRRSDLIESIHDGSFFHDNVKNGLFLPASIVMIFLWCSGMYLFAQPYMIRARKKKNKEKAATFPAIQ